MSKDFLKDVKSSLLKGAAFSINKVEAAAKAGKDKINVLSKQKQLQELQVKLSDLICEQKDSPELQKLSGNNSILELIQNIHNLKEELENHNE